jgi:hypothetical protein
MIGKKRLVVGLVVACVVTFALAVGSVQGMELAVRNASVYPPVGNWSDHFNYSVNVSFYKGIEIELWIYHPGENKWKPCETQKYNARSGEWQPLRWNIQPFSPGCKGETSSYEFWWNKEVLEIEGRKTFEGPHIKEIKEEFKNATVTPASGCYKTPFNYSVEVNTSEDVVLNIYDISINEWGEKGTGNRIGNRWEWRDITFSEDCEGLASYRFFFIDSGKRYESDTFRDPILKPLNDDPKPEVIFENANVDPPKGNFSTSFNYTVEVNSGIEIKNVTLEVYNGSWRLIGNGTHKLNGNIWEWKGIRVGKGGYEGNAKYRFFCNNEYESAIYYGPLLLNETTKPDVHYYGGGGGGGGSSYKPYMLYENANVDPPDCTLKGAIESKTFYYTVEVDKDDKLILEIYNSSSEEWGEKGKGEKSKLTDKRSKWKHEWAVDLTLNKNWAGHGKYRFYPERKEKYRSQVYYGPEIKMPSLSGWKEEIGFSDKVLKKPGITPTVNPPSEKWFKKFTYTAEINHPDKANMTVVLFVYKPGSNKWEPVPWRGDRFNPIVRSSDYDERKNATVSWTVEKEDIFDEKDAGKKSTFSRFYIWYWDGWNEPDCKKLESEDYDGPEVLEKPELRVNHEPEYTEFSEITPDPGSTHCEYEYKFGVNDSDGDTVHGWLTITGPPKVEAWQTPDPPNETYIIGGYGSGGNISFRVVPDRGIFTDKKVEEYLKRTNKTFFTSSYRLEYWDEGMMVAGTTKTEPGKDVWFTGPNVTKVNVTYTEPIVSPNRGTYANEFEYRIEEFYSDRDNSIHLTLTIYDPTDRNKTWSPKIGRTIDLEVPAGGKKPASWKIKPEVFGPGDCGKNASYTIKWRHTFGNERIINGTGPYIERAVPLLSLDRPLVPLVSMVIVPLGVIGISLLSVLSGVPVSSLLKNVSSKLRKGRAKGTEKKKEGEKEEKKEEAGES